MPDEKGQPLPGEPTHWRFRKDQAIKGNGTTKVSDVYKPKPKEEKKKKIYTKAEILDLVRKDQEEILNKRGVKFLYKDNEKDLVKKILDSN